MAGNHFRRDEGETSDGERPARGFRVRRFDGPHPVRSKHSNLESTDDQNDLADSLSDDRSPRAARSAPTLDAEPSTYRSDPLLATQAAQLVDYIRTRQADLARRQEQLDEQHQHLERARDEFERTRRELRADVARTTAEFETQNASDEAIQLLLEQLEQQRCQAVAPARPTASTSVPPAAAERPSESPTANPELARGVDRSGASTAPPQNPWSVPWANPGSVAPASVDGRGERPGRGASSAPPVSSMPPAGPDPFRAAPPFPDSGANDGNNPFSNHRVSPDWDARWTELERREAEVARRSAAAEQLLAEVRQRHQESLELRIVTEQLWGQLAGRLAPDELTRSLRQLRSKLDAQYRQAREELDDQQDHVAELVERLDQQQQHLRRQRRDLQAWVDRRHEELEQAHGQLLARQQELDRRQRQLEAQRAAVDEETREYQRQIRQLTAQLRCRDELGRVA